MSLIGPLSFLPAIEPNDFASPAIFTVPSWATRYAPRFDGVAAMVTMGDFMPVTVSWVSRPKLNTRPSAVASQYPGPTGVGMAIGGGGAAAGAVLASDAGDPVNSPRFSNVPPMICFESAAIHPSSTLAYTLR